MSPTELENKLNGQTLIEPGMVSAAFDFWFNDTGHIRSPFPFYIREELRTKATLGMLEWGEGIDSKARDGINDEILAEKFEEILFELASKMVITEDEKLTLKYPFMIRTGDLIRKNSGESGHVVTDRYILKRGDSVFLKVKLKSNETGEAWETEFELPE